MLIGIESGPALTEDIGLYQFIGLTLLLIASIMALRVLADIFTTTRDRRLGPQAVEEEVEGAAAERLAPIGGDRLLA